MQNNFELKLIDKKDMNAHTVHFIFDIINQQKLTLIAGQLSDYYFNKMVKKFSAVIRLPIF